MKKFIYIFLAVFLILPFAVKADDAVSVWTNTTYGTLACPSNNINSKGSITCALTGDNTGVISFASNDSITIEHDGGSVKFTAPDISSQSSNKTVTIVVSASDDNNFHESFNLEIINNNTTSSTESSSTTTPSTSSSSSSATETTPNTTTETVKSTSSSDTENPNTSDINVIELATLSLIFMALVVLSFKKVVNNN